MSPNNDLGKSYAEYKKIRGREKLAIKKRHQKGDFYPDWCQLVSETKIISIKIL